MALLEIASDIQEHYEIEFEQIGADLDHIHLLFSAHSKMSIGGIVGKFKSITARQLFKRIPELKGGLWAASV